MLKYKILKMKIIVFFLGGGTDYFFSFERFSTFAGWYVECYYYL